MGSTKTYPKGWSVSDIGNEGYLVVHDGQNDDGTMNGGHAFKVHDLDDVDAVIANRGRIPEHAAEPLPAPTNEPIVAGFQSMLRNVPFA